MAFGTSGISPGDRFGRYVIEAQLGAGGMAVVYRARDEDLGRQVALKILTVELAEDPAFRQRFIRESRVAASVDHPNIIPIYEAGESEQRLFIAMRFVRGGDVGTVLKEKGALAPGRVMNVIGPVAGALDAAHSAGIVHRDVKPANLLLDDRQDPGSHVYLTDFGITAIVAGPSATITSPGSVLGTPSYMAPEQVAGAAVTGQADQWGLACAAYELLCGSTPFAGDVNLTVLLYRVLYENPASVAALRPELPAVVDAVFARALAKSAADRYPTCGEFAAALKAALGLAGGFGVLGDAFTAAPPPPQAAATAPARAAPGQMPPSRPGLMPSTSRSGPPFATCTSPPVPTMTRFPRSAMRN
jgi:serine/threonine protein kinase